MHDSVRCMKSSFYRRVRAGQGFTLIELLIVIGIIAVLAGIVIVALNPARQFAQARDAQRTSNINAILNAIGQRMADNKGVFKGGGCNDLPTATTSVLTSTGVGAGELGCLAPTYIPALPSDPTTGSRSDSGYSFYQDVNGRVHVLATAQESSIPRTMPLEIVR